MIKVVDNILFASDLSTDMKKVFEQAAAMSAYCKADIIVLHVMEETSSNSQKRVKMAFGEALYNKIKSDQKSGAQNLLIGKNVDALKIRKAISGFFDGTDPEKNSPDHGSPIKKILVAEGRSIADEIVSTAVEENCGFIVMGCRQQGLLAETIGDNLVKKVIKRSRIPVFVVPFKDSK